MMWPGVVTPRSRPKRRILPSLWPQEEVRSSNPLCAESTLHLVRSLAKPGRQCCFLDRAVGDADHGVHHFGFVCFMTPTIHLEKDCRNRVRRALVSVMENMSLAEGKCVSGGKLEDVGTLLLVVPLVQGASQSCLKQGLVANAAFEAAEQGQGTRVDGDCFLVGEPDWLCHFFDNSR